ncbi:hypothetical protein [Goodfellowiella coeruleoviolacea]|uniref:PE domain-containing protein n=1 Tax=Goodfellowiella coeruleoviolacea TaxID=334858 RepID=A0AAE3GA30_9PSEU|nr:hypothetical protein [Goodfellowiella coeruleoviolacea]MCP2164028.1 hypothetical protein [Goodfellowiella coeruleoviolacea]
MNEATPTESGAAAARAAAAVQLVNTAQQIATAPSVAQVAILAKRMASLQQAVRSGQVVLDKEAGNALLSMLTEQIDQVDSWARRASAMARRVPIGQNPVGEAMAEKIERRAGSDAEHSFGSVLTNYRGVLQDAHDAVSGAMARYSEVERSNAETFTRLVD